MATLKATADANEEDLIELKKQNTTLRKKLDEKEKTECQHRQLNQITKMLRERKTINSIVVKPRPVSINSILMKPKPVSIDSTRAGSANERGDTDRGDTDCGVGLDQRANGDTRSG